MVNKSLIDQCLDLFEIPHDKNLDDEDYGNDSKEEKSAVVPFEEKIKEMKEFVQKTLQGDDKPIALSRNSSEICEKESESVMEDLIKKSIADEDPKDTNKIVHEINQKIEKQDKEKTQKEKEMSENLDQYDSIKGLDVEKLFGGEKKEEKKQVKETKIPSPSPKKEPEPTPDPSPTLTPEADKPKPKDLDIFKLFADDKPQQDAKEIKQVENPTVVKETVPILPEEEIKEEQVEEIEEEDEEKDEDEKTPRPSTRKMSEEDTTKSLRGEFNLVSPQQAYDYFYKEKAYVVKRYISNPIPFDALREELRNSSVDVSLREWDQKEITKKMQHVQKLRDRIREIQLDLNLQYYPIGRSVELLRGILARAHYEKPASKQDGVIAEHMGDLERYFTEVYALYKSAEQNSRNLDGAFDCLSRHVTISTPLRDIERSAPPEQKVQEAKPQKPSKEMEDYDGLEEGPKKSVRDPNKKAEPVIVGWGDIKSPKDY